MEARSRSSWLLHQTWQSSWRNARWLNYPLRANWDNQLIRVQCKTSSGVLWVRPLQSLLNDACNTRLNVTQTREAQVRQSGEKSQRTQWAEIYPKYCRKGVVFKTKSRNWKAREQRSQSGGWVCDGEVQRRGIVNDPRLSGKDHPLISGSEKNGTAGFPAEVSELSVSVFYQTSLLISLTRLTPPLLIN